MPKEYEIFFEKMKKINSDFEQENDDVIVGESSISESDDGVIQMKVDLL
jgi:hypothetical protein